MIVYEVEDNPFIDVDLIDLRYHPYINRKIL